MEHEATPTLRPVPGIDLHAYRNELIHRFSNPAIRDTLARQMVDASERIPKFVLPVVREQLRLGGPIDRAALVIAAWARFLEVTDVQGEPVDITDRRLGELRAAVRADHAEPGAFLNLTDMFGDLGRNARFAAAYRQAREALERSGARTAVQDLTELRYLQGEFHDRLTHSQSSAVSNHRLQRPHHPCHRSQRRHRCRHRQAAHRRGAKVIASARRLELAGSALR